MFVSTSLMDLYKCCYLKSLVTRTAAAVTN